MQTEPSKSKRPLHKTRYPGVYWRESKRGRRYVIQYRDSDGKQRFPTVEGGLEQARAELERVLARKRGGELLRPVDNSISFREAAQQFFAIEVKAIGLEARTVDSHKERLERVYPYLGHIQVSRIRAETIAGLVAFLREQGRYSEQTTKGTLASVRRVLSYRKVTPNPVSLLEPNKRPKPDEREKRILSRDEIDKLIATCSPTYRPLVQTAIFTGARKMEVLGLRWSDVDFDAQVIRIREQLSRKAGEGRKVLKNKSKGRRDVDIPAFLVQMLREHKARSPFSKDTDYAFTTGSGKPFGWSNVDRQGLHKASERAKLREPHPRFHDLRHTFVSMLIAQGRPLSYVAKQIGDSIETTSRTYAHLFDAARHAGESRAAMEAAFGEMANSWQTAGSESLEAATMAPVVDIASVQEKR